MTKIIGSSFSDLKYNYPDINIKFILRKGNKNLLSNNINAWFLYCSRFYLFFVKILRMIINLF